MKNSGKTVSKRCAAPSVAEITTLRGPARRSQERERRGRGVDNDETAGQPVEQRGPLRRLEIRTDQVELGVGAVERAVTDQDDQEEIVRRHARPERAHGAAHVGRGCTGGPLSRLFEHHDVARHELHTLAQHARELIGPSRVLFERTADRRSRRTRSTRSAHRQTRKCSTRARGWTRPASGTDTSSSKSPPTPQEPLRRQQRDDRQEGP